MDTLKRCVLAVDSGGTKCEALLVRDDGVVLGRGRCAWNDPGSGRSDLGSGRSKSTVTRAVHQALAGARCDELHLVAVAFRQFIENELAAQVARTVIAHRINEGDPLFTLSGEVHGIAVVAGTGAAVYGRMPGHLVRLDGLGPLLGDYGSGYHIGSLALRAAARADWGPRYQTTLTDAVPCALGVAETRFRTEFLIEFTLERRDRAEIAALAQIVDREARNGDRIAAEILRQAAAAMAETVCATAARLGVVAQQFPFIGGGSVAVASDIFWEHLCDRVRAVAPGMQPVRVTQPAVVGAALIVLHALGAAPDALDHDLLASASPMPERREAS